jgi:hypothetical protein
MSKASSLIASMFFRAANADAALATIHPFSPNRKHHNVTPNDVRPMSPDFGDSATIPAADMRLVRPLTLNGVQA